MLLYVLLTEKEKNLYPWPLDLCQECRVERSEGRSEQTTSECFNAIVEFGQMYANALTSFDSEERILW